MPDEAPPKPGTAWPIAFAMIGIGLIALAGFIFKSCIDQPARMAETIARASQPQITVNTVIQTSLERLRKESKLVVYTADVAVMITKVSDKKVLYGKIDLGTTVVRVRAAGNKAQLIIPLNELSEGDIRFNEKENKFIVTLPPPRVDETLVEVQTDPKFYEVQTELGWARLDRFSGEFLREEAKRELRGSVIAEASDPRIIEAARQSGREQIGGLLEAVIKPMRSEATVAVEFKEEATKR